jgi:hypothetical protein
MSKDELRLRARNLLALALEAQGRGEAELSEQLTARAMQLLDEANGSADQDVAPVAPPSASAVPQQQQQQQQRQTEGKDGESE